MLPGTAPAPAITPKIFFDLLNEVLISFGRDKLEEDSPQKNVIRVHEADRVLQILAGPGSGKTEVIVWRALYEMFVNAVPANRLIVTTFTKRAATELQIRVVERSDEFITIGNKRGVQIVDPQVHNLRIGTIHSLCDALLAEFDNEYVEAGTQVIEEAEASIRIAKNYRYALGYSTPPERPYVVNRLENQEALVALLRPPWDDRWPSRVMERVDYIQALLAQHTETWIPRCRAMNTLNGIEPIHQATGLTEDLCKLQSRWEAYLDTHHILDFATIQKRFWERQNNLLGSFDHVFVDEFQDSNPIQFAIHTQWLQNPKTRLTVVGDDDQAIYRFRGSDIECFQGLKPACISKNIPYRLETLSVNYRSTENIIAFTESFKSHTVLSHLSMPKKVTHSPKATRGSSVRLLSGSWEELCAVTAAEIDTLGAGRPQEGEESVPTVAVLAFSTSEREFRERRSPALALRRAIEARDIRVYNPRNKTAGNHESPVSMLLGLISYLIDPVSHAPIGKNGRLIEVWASMRDHEKGKYGIAQPPPFPMNDRHAALQKAFIKADGGKIGSPATSRAGLLSFVDDIRTRLIGEKARLTLSGFVARLLAFPLFRHSGFTLALFRQAFFTQLLEANIAPTRLSMESLDQPLEVALSGGKFVWPNRFWNLLSVFGGYLDNTNLDDPEVEAFEEDAILMITFHQAKGLEFDHIYVAATGRDPDVGPALRTHLFSGFPVEYRADGGLATKDPHILELAMADREREVYVALTRGKSSLTILHDPGLANLGFYSLNPALGNLFANCKPTAHPLKSAVEVREFTRA